MTLRTEINLTDSEIAARFDDELGCEGTSFADLAFVADTIADFRSARQNTWSDGGALARDEDGVYIVYGAQAGKGQSRKDVVVIDLGAARAVML